MMTKQLRMLGFTMLIGGLAAACSNSDSLITPRPTASFAKGGGGGGGGTDVPPTPVPTVPTSVPTMSVTSPNTTIFAGQPMSVLILAVSERNNRNAPIVTVTSAPPGFVLGNVVVVDSPHGGGPGHTQAQYTWTPTRDQIGLVAHPTFVATTGGGAVTVPTTLPVVQDAPTAATELTATRVADHIEARWQASTGGVGTITYDVSACYRNANIRPTAATCDRVATTTSTAVLNIPATNPAPTVQPSGGVATYFLIMVTPRDAAGSQATPASVDVR